MKRFLFAVLVYLSTGPALFAQVAVSDNGCTPDPSAVFEVHSSTKGFLGPQVALTSVTSAAPVTNPATGLLVFNTTENENGTLQKGYYYWRDLPLPARWVHVDIPSGVNQGDMLCWNGIQWVRIPAGNAGDVLKFTGGTPIWVQAAEEPTILTDTVTAVTPLTAHSGGNVSDNGAIVTERGLCFGTTPNPTISGDTAKAGAGSGTFDKGLAGLEPNTTYYVRAYATNSVGTGYGEARSFTTPSGVNTITTTAVTAITPGMASSGGTITDEGGEPVIGRGVCWSTSANPTITDPHTMDGSGTGTYSSELTNLVANTTYHVRAYATSAASTYYGSEVTFATPASAIPPTLTTITVSNVTTISASSGGNITSGGGAPIFFRGVCWNTTAAPSLLNNHTADGSGTGTFTSTLTGLISNEMYYYKAYVNNSLGTFYGNELTFTTPLSITTNTVSSITQTTASCGGTIAIGGDHTYITARGVCWDTATNPTITNSHSSNGSNTGSFNSNLTGLVAGTLYYARAYGINSSGTFYGNQQTFTTSPPTPPPPALPTVTTSEVYSILATTATSGGNVTSSGGAPVTARGICWKDGTGTPVITDDSTLNGSGTGMFISQLTNLNTNMNYTVRAYAINSAGVSYGTAVTFRTLSSAVLPSVTTDILTNITSTTATCGGTVTSQGGSPVFFRGVCWSLSPNPTIGDNHTADGSGTGFFISSITGLTPNTNYYVRAYAMNSAGTSYGNQVSINNPYYIGGNFGGGIIFYIDGSSLHGLVAAPIDIIDPQGWKWGCDGTSIPGTGAAIGVGQANTSIIVSNCAEAEIAARICDTLTLNSYTDWFLPSKDELNLMYLQKTVIGGFSTSDYWSSTEYNFQNAWKQNFSDGSQSTTRKRDNRKVRAIRAF